MLCKWGLKTLATPKRNSEADARIYHFTCNAPPTFSLTLFSVLNGHSFLAILVPSHIPLSPHVVSSFPCFKITLVSARPLFNYTGIILRARELHIHCQNALSELQKKQSVAYNFQRDQHEAQQKGQGSTQILLNNIHQASGQVTNAHRVWLGFCQRTSALVTLLTQLGEALPSINEWFRKNNVGWAEYSRLRVWQTSWIDSIHQARAQAQQAQQQQQQQQQNQQVQGGQGQWQGQEGKDGGGGGYAGESIPAGASGDDAASGEDTNEDTTNDDTNGEQVDGEEEEEEGGDDDDDGSYDVPLPPGGVPGDEDGEDMGEDEYLEGMEERREEREEARGEAVGTGPLVAEEYGDSGDESNGPSSDNMG